MEKGFGLPQVTTVQRLAYNPPRSGYKVYDTDLGKECIWSGTVW